MKLATFNVENMFERAAAMNLPTWADGKAVLEVADTGIGIPNDATSHIFDRFYRVDRARSRQLGGTGLGLAIVKSICTAYNGAITVKSDEGKGAIFRVELPLEKN